MNSPAPRYQILKPLTVGQRVYLANSALRFFSPMQYKENCGVIGKVPDERVIRPLSGLDFMKFLSSTEAPKAFMPEPNRYFRRIDELLRQLTRAGLLTDVGGGQSPLLGNHYYALQELTSIESKGSLILARALGPSFLHWAYRKGTYQITGTCEDGSQHAGTGIAIAPRWLLTCAHVVEDMNVDSYQDWPAGGFNIVREVPHESVDVALIEVDRDLHVVNGINFQDPRVGERVYTLGYPRVPLSIEAALVVQGGEVSVEAVTSFTQEALFLFSAIARPGNSGGPIVSEDGHVVGIVTKELSENDPLKQPFHAGIASSVIDLALRELNCPVSLPIENWQ